MMTQPAVTGCRVILPVVTANNLEMMGSNLQNSKVENREHIGETCQNANKSANDAVHHENSLLINCIKAECIKEEEESIKEEIIECHIKDETATDICRVILPVVTANNLEIMGINIQNDGVENREHIEETGQNANKSANDAVHHEHSLLIDCIKSECIKKGEDSIKEEIVEFHIKDETATDNCRVTLPVVTAYNLEIMGTNIQNNGVENREHIGETCQNANKSANNAVQHENSLRINCIKAECIKEEEETIKEEIVECHSKDETATDIGSIFFNDEQQTDKQTVKNLITTTENEKESEEKMDVVSNVIKTEVLEQVSTECKKQERLQELNTDGRQGKSASESMIQIGNHIDQKIVKVSISTDQRAEPRKSKQIEDTSKYVCDHCSVQFVLKDEVKEHIIDHFTYKPYVCLVCKKCFLRLEELRMHKRCHLCAQCNGCFASEKEIQLHVVQVHLKLRRCIPCNKVFTISEYKQHIAIHKAQQSTCSVCNKNFKNKGNLLRHEKIHKRDFRFSCKLCKKPLKGLVQLNTHMLHCHMPPDQKTEQNKCYECGKSFEKCQSLYQHLKIHYEKQYICDKCGKKFSQQHQLNNHMTSHNEVRNYVCDTCGAKFKMPHHLRNHIKTHMSSP